MLLNTEEYQNQHKKVQKEFIKVIPSWFKLFIMWVVDISFFGLLLYIVFQFEYESAYTVIFILGGILLTYVFIFLRGTNGRTIGMFVLNISYASLRRFDDIKPVEYRQMYWRGYIEDMKHHDWYESFEFLTSSLKQTLAMKRMHIVYANKKKLDEFKQENKEVIKKLDIW